LTGTSSYGFFALARLFRWHGSPGQGAPFGLRGKPSNSRYIFSGPRLPLFSSSFSAIFSPLGSLKCASVPLDMFTSRVARPLTFILQFSLLAAELFYGRPLQSIPKSTRSRLMLCISAGRFQRIVLAEPCCGSRPGPAYTNDASSCFIPTTWLLVHRFPALNNAAIALLSPAILRTPFNFRLSHPRGYLSFCCTLL